ncbi:beta-ketoacyl-[acyl-carrier-protein] synthase family protein [Rubinisphaera margarita]|uniref:beta-ketoacyl-[acyl-carrier-protein] synthase family protein n=1 Tax=Rubinisphaera margarita TaxID=2909586 RepID=UPI001EE7F3CA|nr:beta-ketoacyl-[acyl-carrier-protein] synthase family protein [Rubinisphaera margarita]MCG6155452.1 beta-ketoacyl-[acyl-carrier-protein] synthase family protein [Rubinisphaera margarita]
MSEDSNQRVAITGMGMVSACGNGIDAFEKSLLEGRSGISAIDLFPGVTPPGHIGAQCRDFNDSSIKKEYLKPQRKSIKVMCRDIQLGVASANLALEHSGLGIKEEEDPRLGVEFGADLMLSPPDVLFGAVAASRNEQGMPTDTQWGEKGLAQMEPLWLLKYLPNMPACHISIYAKACGPSNSLTLEDANGNLTLGESLRIMRRGQADTMIAGTTGARLHVIKSINLTSLKEVAEPNGQAPEEVLKPFDKNRSGEVLGEGACAFILEREDKAKERNATIFAYVLGIGSSCVRHPKTGPDPKQAMVNAIRAALRSADVTIDQIGHINAHGSGSQTMDAAEAAAILEVFGDRGREIPVTALKPFFGNCGSGSGTLEIAGSILGLRHGVVFPTLNYATPDPECPLNIVHGEPLKTDNKIFLNINVTRAGQASALLVEGA